MDPYKKLIRPLLFKLDTETAHNLAKCVLRHPGLTRLLANGHASIEDQRLRVSLGRIALQNPVGLGAGFDKDCEMVDSLQRLGFGYVVVGSVMCRVRAGNPRPRMIRDVKREGLFSCMGLPSKGLEYAVASLKRRKISRAPLIINFNADDFQEYLRCAEVLGPLGDAIEIALFCPNRSADQGEYLEPDRARTLLEEVAKRTNKPILVKVPGYDSEEERQKRLRLIDTLINHNVDAITMTAKTLVKEKRLSIGQGTLTGRPAFEKMLVVVRDVFEASRGRCAIKAAGGIFSAEDAFAVIAAGATTVELVTGFGFEGWSVATKINRGLLRLLDKSGIENIRALRGTATDVRPA